MTTKTITIFNDDGSFTAYRPLSQRVPEFLRHYPPEQGYAVIIEVQDTLNLRPGLRRLYERAVSQGHKPEAVGLPPVTQEVVMQFQAKLVDAQGRVLGMASAIKPIHQYKDYEIGETAARQRLLAALGFGGEVFDAEEEQDRRAMGIAPVDSAILENPGEVMSQAAPVCGEPVTPEPDRETPAVEENDEGQDDATALEPEDNGTVPENLDPAGPGNDPETLVQDTVPVPAETLQPPSPVLMRQIAHLAALKQQAVPVCATRAEAKKVLKALMQV
jgi:hypothetical protein